MNAISRFAQTRSSTTAKIFMNFAKVYTSLKYKFKILDKIRETSYKDISPELDMKFK
jgi:hypothetical protein